MDLSIEFVVQVYEIRCGSCRVPKIQDHNAMENFHMTNYQADLCTCLCHAHLHDFGNPMVLNAFMTI